MAPKRAAVGAQRPRPDARLIAARLRGTIAAAVMTVQDFVWRAATLAALTLAARAAPADPPRPTTAGSTLLSRPVEGTAKLSGLATVMESDVVPQWPVELMPPANGAPCTAPSCTEWQQLERALFRAGEWLASFPQTALRFDAAMGLSQIRQTVDSDALRVAFKRARTVADRDNDHPHRRFWIPGFHAPARDTSQWEVPSDGSQRVNTNRVVSEALHCAENGWRAQTMRYVCGPMRDSGGYQTTHALWALHIAHQNGCIAEADFDACARALQSELRTYQPTTLEPHATLDIDLYAERLLTLVLSGYPDPVVNDWAADLIHLQGRDGSWGVSANSEEPYYRYHATMVVSWALAEWCRRLVGHPEVRPAGEPPHLHGTGSRRIPPRIA